MTGSDASGGLITDATAPRPVSFPELVRAHFRWARQLHRDNGGVSEKTEGEFRRKLVDFEHHEGRILEAYWCRSEASAVALTAKSERAPRTAETSRHRLVRLVRPRRRPSQPSLRLHRVTDWVTVDMPAVAELLHHCDTLAIKVGEVLEGTAKRVAMQWILSIEEHLLGFVEQAKQRTLGRGEMDRFITHQKKELVQVEDYYYRAGQKRARQIYVTGMLIGLATLPAIAVGGAALIAVFHELNLRSEHVQTFFACFAAGALGAVVSVLSRMSGKRGGFTVDHEIGERGLRRLGSYRPLVGAIFGLAVYFLARTPIVQIDDKTKTFPFYVVVAFLAGFSERWTNVVLGGAEQTIRESLGGGAKAAT